MNHRLTLHLQTAGTLSHCPPNFSKPKYKHKISDMKSTTMAKPPLIIPIMHIQYSLNTNLIKSCLWLMKVNASWQIQQSILLHFLQTDIITDSFHCCGNFLIPNRIKIMNLKNVTFYFRWNLINTWWFIPPQLLNTNHVTGTSLRYMYCSLPNFISSTYINYLTILVSPLLQQPISPFLRLPSYFYVWNPQ